MKKSLITGALIAVIAISTFVAHKESMKLADMRADEIYSETLAQATRAIPRSSAQRIVNTPEEKKFLSGIVKQQYKEDTFTEKTISGTLAVMHEDKFGKDGMPLVEEGENIHKLYLVTPTEMFRVENISYPVMENLHGVEISLTGLLSSKKNEKGEKLLIVNLPEAEIKNLRLKPLKPVKDWNSLDSERGGSCGGSYCAFIVPVDLSGGSIPVPSPSDMYNYIFTSPGKIKSNLYEQSYGQMTYGGQIANTWLQLSASDLQTPFPNIPPQVEQYILNNNIDLNDYDQIVYLVNDPINYTSYSTVGPLNFVVNGQTYSLARSAMKMGFYLFPPSLLAANGNLTWWERMWVHETGHALGALHDNALVCEHGPMSLPSECLSREYGNSYSGMGMGTLGAHFSFFKKEQIGWIDSSHIILGQNGSNLLHPLELSNPRVIKSTTNIVQEPNNGYIFEFRKPIGLDSIGTNNIELDGIFVYRNFLSFPNLVDVSPASTSNFLLAETSLKDAVLQNAQSLSNINTGAQFTGIYNPLIATVTSGGPGVGSVGISSIAATCVTQPIKIFEYTYANANGYADIAEGQLPPRNWPQANFTPDLTQVLDFPIDNADVNSEISLHMQYDMFIDDSTPCGGAQIERSVYLDGQIIEGPISQVKPAWALSYMSNPITISGYNLSYGQHTITLVLNKLNDGSTITQDFLFNVIPI